MVEELQKIGKLEIFEKNKSNFIQCSLNNDDQPLVNFDSDEHNVYNYDNIIEDLFDKNKPQSVDCLCLRKSINFIEFKSTIGFKKDELKTLIQSIKLKFTDSLLCFNNLIIFPNNINVDNLRKNAYLVVEYKKSPRTALSAAYSRVSNCNTIQNDFDDNIKDSLAGLGKTDKSGNKAFFDEFELLNDLNFENFMKRKYI